MEQINTSSIFGRSVSSGAAAIDGPGMDPTPLAPAIAWAATGGNRDEAALDAVGRQEAERLRRVLLRQVPAGPALAPGHDRGWAPLQGGPVPGGLPWTGAAPGR